MPTQLRRRWYQFSLRTMLIVMVLLSAAFGYWVHWSKEWIRQRNERIADPRCATSVIWERPYLRPRAPSGLWLFGEEGVSGVVCPREDVDLVRQLFPEARIVGVM